MASKKLIERITQEMITLDTYKPEYLDMIRIYADLIEEYYRSTKLLKAKTSLINTMAKAIKSEIKKGTADVKYLVENAEKIANMSAYTTTTAAGGSKKSGLVASIETLRKDIVTYSDRLLLNPKSEKEGTRTTSESKLDIALGFLSEARRDS